MRPSINRRSIWFWVHNPHRISCNYLAHSPSEIRRSRISQAKIVGFSRLYCSILETTVGVATLGFEPPIKPGGRSEPAKIRAHPRKLWDNRFMTMQARFWQSIWPPGLSFVFNIFICRPHQHEAFWKKRGEKNYLTRYRHWEKIATTFHKNNLITLTDTS